MVFDVGAHYGESVIEYRKLYPDSEIHSFEPDGKTFATLQSAVQGLERVTCIQKALSDSEGKATFFVNESSATNSLLPLSGNAKELWGDAVRSQNEQKEATLTTLDNYCEESHVSHVHILKIDVQGAELRVLQGARQMLEKAAIDVIVCEVIVSQTYQGQNAFWQYLQFAEQHGLALVDLLHPVRKRNQLLQLDAVFVRNGLLNR